MALPLVTEAHVPGRAIAETLGEVEAEVAPQILRGVIALTRMVEEELRRQATALGADAVHSVTIRIRPRLLWTSARASGIAVRLGPSQPPGASPYREEEVPQ